jgi:hypothetical protein
LRDERGHATSEAVIMLPFFIMVWGCIIWASQSFENEIDLAAKTREHTWQHAMNDCRGATGADTQVTDYSGGGISGGIESVFSLIDQVAGLFAVMEDWPGLTFDEHQYVREDVVTAPNVAGGNNRETYYRTVLMCNEVHDTPDIEETAWSAFTIFAW